MQKKLLIKLILMTIAWIELCEKSNCNTDPGKDLKASHAECGGRFRLLECSDSRIISIVDAFITLNGNSSYDCQRTVGLSCVQPYSLPSDCYKYAIHVMFTAAKALCNSKQKCDSMLANATTPLIRTKCSKSTKTCFAFQLTFTCVQDTKGHSPRDTFIGLIVGASVLTACLICSILVFLLRKRKMSPKKEDSPQMSKIAKPEREKTNNHEEPLYSEITVLESSTTADKSSRPTNHSHRNAFFGQRTEETMRQHSTSMVDTTAVEPTYMDMQKCTYAKIAEPFSGKRVLQKHLEERFSEVKLDDEVTVIENVNFYF